MPMNLTITSSGIDKATRILNNYTKNITKVLSESLDESALRVKDELNREVEEYQNKAEIFKTSPLKIFIGPSPDFILDIEAIPDWIKYEGMKRCPWWKYIRYIEPEIRMEFGTARDKVGRVVQNMIPVISDITVKYIKELLR